MARSITGTYITTPPKPKKKRVFNTVEVEDKDRVDPQIVAYAIGRTIPFVIVVFALFSLFRYAELSETYAILLAATITSFSLIKADAKQLGNRFTVTRYEGFTPNTPTRLVDKEGKTLLLKDVVQ